MLVREMMLADHIFLNVSEWPLISRIYENERIIGVRERLAVTLRYCVTGNAQTTIATSYMISRSTVCKVITETCDAICTAFMGKVF